ncbi:MAG: hypothetical protein ACMXX5_02240 [Candidatus Woesearchaeota archaeon]
MDQEEQIVHLQHELADELECFAKSILETSRWLRRTEMTEDEEIYAGVIRDNIENFLRRFNFCYQHKKLIEKR